jgi:hypothetical protein
VAIASKGKQNAINAAIAVFGSLDGKTGSRLRGLCYNQSLWIDLYTDGQ